MDHKEKNRYEIFPEVRSLLDRATKKAFAKQIPFIAGKELSGLLAHLDFNPSHRFLLGTAPLLGNEAGFAYLSDEKVTRSWVVQFYRPANEKGSKYDVLDFDLQSHPSYRYLSNHMTALWVPKSEINYRDTWKECVESAHLCGIDVVPARALLVAALESPQDFSRN